MQTYYISRNGLKDYQKNNRPLLGDGIQEYASCVGMGMLDATVCDIYLVNDAVNDSSDIYAVVHSDVQVNDKLVPVLTDYNALCSVLFL